MKAITLVVSAGLSIAFATQTSPVVIQLWERASRVLELVIAAQ